MPSWPFKQFSALSDPIGSCHITTTGMTTCPSTGSGESPNSFRTVWTITVSLHSGHDNNLIQELLKSLGRN